VSLPEGSVRAWGIALGEIVVSSAVFDPADNTLAVRLANPPKADIVTIVIDYSIADLAGNALDGEVATPASPVFPTGDGVQGGRAVVRYEVLQGDANRDGIVDSADADVLVASLGKSSGTPGFDSRADLNGDGFVNVLDVAIWVNGRGGALPSDDGVPVAFSQISPDPSSPIYSDTAAVGVAFSEAVDPAHLEAADLFVVGTSGGLQRATSVSLNPDGLGAQFVFDPPLARCDKYRLNLSNAIADLSGSLAVRPTPAPVLDGLVPAPVPTIDPVTPLVSAPLVTIAGNAPAAVQTKIIGPLGVVVVPVVNGRFEAEVGLPPNEVSTIHISSVSPCGQPSAAATTRVTRDTNPPFVIVDFPLSTSELIDPLVTVVGRVGDELSGIEGLSVTINGLPAQVSVGTGTNGTFVLTGVPLAVGQQSLQISATDRLGNSKTIAHQVTRFEPTAGTPLMMVVSGDAQAGPALSELPQPIRVRLTRPDGQPLQGKLVTFDVVRNDGLLAASPGGAGNGSNRLQIFTDSGGFAEAYWRLGSTAGAGANSVSVTSKDLVGAAYFCASGQTGVPQRILVGVMNNQRAEAGAPLPQSIAAFVTDGDTGNPVPGVPVTFLVTEGDGHFANGKSSTTALTGNNGRAFVSFVTGKTSGRNTIEANFVGNPGLPAVFSAIGVQRVQGAPTTFAAVVQDNANRAIGGADATMTLSLDFPDGPRMATLGPVFSDINGRFVFDSSSIPPDALNTVLPGGPVKLHVSGVNATTLGGEPIEHDWTFPFIGLDFSITENAANTLPNPIWLPMLDPANEVFFDGSQDVELTMAGIEGLKFTVRAGSLTREDGTKPSPGDPEILRLNQVHFDEVPMPLPDGNAFPLAWTMQPKNARFDPPVAVELPNLTGLPAGSVVELLQWNNAMAEFQKMGTMRVAPDGSLLITETGSGLTVAGWGGGAPPPPPTGAVGNEPAFRVQVSSQLACSESAQLDFRNSLLAAAHSQYRSRAHAISAISDAPDFAESMRLLVAETAYNIVTLPSPTKVFRLVQVLRQPAVATSGLALELTTDVLADIAVDTLIFGERTERARAARQAVSDFVDDITRSLTIHAAYLSNCQPLPNDALVDLITSRLLSSAGRINGLLADIEDKATPSGAILQEDFILLLTRIDNELREVQRLIEIGAPDGSFVSHADSLEQLSTRVGDEVYPAIEQITEGLGEYFDNDLLDDSQAFETDILGPELSWEPWRVFAQSAPGEPTPADFGRFVVAGIPVTGDLIRVVAISDSPLPSGRVAVSPFVRVIPDQVQVVNEFQVLDQVPLSPVRLTASTVGLERDLTLVLEPGQNMPVAVFGTLSDGSQADLTSATEGSSYRTSNSAVVNVDGGGSIQATAVGRGFVTASNQGVTTTIRAVVAEAVSVTTIAGVALLPDGSPAAGAVVISSLGGQSVSRLDGSFAFGLSVPSEAVSISVSAVVTFDGRSYSGSVAVSPLVHDGFTDSGVIRLNESCRDLDWLPTFGTNAGVSREVRAFAVFDDGSGPALFAGGGFTFAGGTRVNFIAKWDGTTWSALVAENGVGVNGQVNALTVFDDGSGPGLFVGGNFTMAGGLPANRIAKWDGLSWTGLNAGLDGSVTAMVVFDDGTDRGPELCVGGLFSAAGELAARNIARWNGADWSAMGDGVGDVVFALAVVDDDLDGGPMLYAGGQFASAGAVDANHIAKWDGSTWSAVGQGISGGAVYALVVSDDGSGPALYAAGDFHLAGDKAANNIAKWNGESWSALGTGMDSAVVALAVFDDGSGPALYAGGYFRSSGNVVSNGIAKWRDAMWSGLDSGTGEGTIPFVGAIIGLEAAPGVGSTLYVGGLFLTAGGAAASNVAAWNGDTWFTLGEPSGMPVDSWVFALATFNDGKGSGPALYAGGSFTSAGTEIVNHIAKWDGSMWTALGAGMNGWVSTLAVFDDGDGPALVAGGYFTSAGGQSAYDIAMWDGSEWSALGSGLNGQVLALAGFDDGSGPALYAGGEFTLAGSLNVNHVAKWDGLAWTALGEGVSSAVRSLAVFDDGNGPKLYAGGNFSVAGGTTVNHIARWDGSQWSALGSGVNLWVEALAVYDEGLGDGPSLFAGGWFSAAGDVNANAIAKWDGSSWESLDLGLSDGFSNPGIARALFVFDDGSGSGAALYAGGSFTTAGSVAASRIAKWDGVSWSALRGEVNGGTIHAIMSFEDSPGSGAALYAGGSFVESPAGDAYLAKWGCGSSNRATLNVASRDRHGAPLRGISRAHTHRRVFGFADGNGHVRNQLPSSSKKSGDRSRPIEAGVAGLLVERAAPQVTAKRSVALRVPRPMDNEPISSSGSDSMLRMAVRVTLVSIDRHRAGPLAIAVLEQERFDDRPQHKPPHEPESGAGRSEVVLRDSMGQPWAVVRETPRGRGLPNAEIWAPPDSAVELNRLVDLPNLQLVRPLHTNESGAVVLEAVDDSGAKHQVTLEIELVPAHIGDVTLDGVVDMQDIMEMVSMLTSQDPWGDVDGDGRVSVSDLSVVMGAFGN